MSWKYVINKNKLYLIQAYTWIILDNINIVNSQGKPRTSRRTLTELHFDCEVRSLGKTNTDCFHVGNQWRFFFSLEVCLQDSVLAFHEHGMQGRSLKDNEVTQEVYDQTRSFRVIGSDRYVLWKFPICFLMDGFVFSSSKINCPAKSSVISVR